MSEKMLFFYTFHRIQAALNTIKVQSPRMVLISIINVKIDCGVHISKKITELKILSPYKPCLGSNYEAEDQVALKSLQLHTTDRRSTVLPQVLKQSFRDMMKSLQEETKISLVF